MLGLKGLNRKWSYKASQALSTGMEWKTDTETDSNFSTNVWSCFLKIDIWKSWNQDHERLHAQQSVTSWTRLACGAKVSGMSWTSLVLLFNAKGWSDMAMPYTEPVSISFLQLLTEQPNEACRCEYLRTLHFQLTCLFILGPRCEWRVVIFQEHDQSEGSNISVTWSVILQPHDQIEGGDISVTSDCISFMKGPTVWN